MEISTSICDYEIRSVIPQSAAPTIKIAYQDVTMQDMFERPKYVAELKQLQDVIDNVKDQIREIYRKGLKPTAVLIDYDTERLIKKSVPGSGYIPSYETVNCEADTFLGLDIALYSGQRNKQYIRVVV